MDEIFVKNDLCFCNSNKKLFKCCLKKNLSLYNNINKVIYKNNYNLEMDCIVKKGADYCCNKPINNHSISKSKNLDGHVLFNIQQISSGVDKNPIIFRKVSARKASIFNCICKNCDLYFTKYADLNTFCDNYFIQQHYRNLCYEIHACNIIIEKHKYVNLFKNYLLSKLTDNISLNTKTIFIKGVPFNFNIKYLNKEFFSNLNELFYEKLSPLAQNQDLILDKILNQKKHIENYLNFDLTLKHKNSPLYSKIKEVDKNKLISYISVLYQPGLDLNGDFFSSNSGGNSSILCRDKNGVSLEIKNICGDFVDINVIEKNDKAYLIMSCLKKNENMVSFIDQYFDLKNLESFLNKHSFLFKNSYYKNNFIENISEKQKEVLCTYYSFLGIYTSFYYFENSQIIFKYMGLTTPLHFEKNKLLEQDFNNIIFSNDFFIKNIWGKVIHI